MKRTTLLLLSLSLVLVLVAFYLLVWTPRSDAIAEAEVQIADVQAQQATTEARIVELRGVREQAPALQADLAAAESLLPRDTALPSALRQLQSAADASNANLVSVSPSRPEAVQGAAPGLYGMVVTAEVRGTYFQVVDTLRRLEDPAISPRGLVWTGTDITIDEDAGAPNLIVILTGRMYAVLPEAPASDVEAPDQLPTDDTTDEATTDEETTEADESADAEPTSEGDAEGDQ
jgi:hypothetical protein